MEELKDGYCMLVIGRRGVFLIGAAEILMYHQAEYSRTV